jgi:hypothetical protein
MKKYILIITIFGLIFNAFSQTTISYDNKALEAGDQNTFQSIEYVLPGGSGPNQIWDFSKIRYTGESDEGSLSTSPSNVHERIGNYNLVVTEDDKEYYYYLTNNSLEELGYISEDYDLIYTDPVLKMVYPFAYGNSFTDQYEGNAIFKGVTNIDLNGDYTVTADAYGTLILPDRVLENTLRIKSEKTALEVNMCSSIEVSIVRHFWYAPGYRYPVMYTSVREYSINGKEPVIEKTSGTNLQQTPEVLTNGEENQQLLETDSDVAVIVYPNPFNEKLTYNYFLRKYHNVSIDLYDISGRIDKSLMKSQTQPEGLYTNDLVSTDYSLTPGIYYLRFTFDNKVVVKKIVKL